MDREAIEEMFQSLGPVTVTRLFGGQGVYHRGEIVAIVLGGEMMLKADAESAPELQAAGATQWAYESRKGKAVRMPYWTVPTDAWDDPDIMAHWVRLAYQAAVRSAAKG